MFDVSVKLILVPQSEVCKGLYKPGRSDDALTLDTDRLERRNMVSRVYKLVAGKSTPLQLQSGFHQALIPAIATGKYAVLLVFDWGETLIVVVDFLRGPSKELPVWSSRKQNPKFPSGRFWYAHQNAADFDPAQGVTWQLTLNGDLPFSFLFYVLPAGR